jgi:8-oxo-dGTP pyrophosphatase MutT (NUDIX family)
MKTGLRGRERRTAGIDWEEGSLVSHPPQVRANMRELTHRRAARIIVLDQHGRVLLFRHARSNGESFWAPPGGGLEDGETFEDAAVREAWEELGAAAVTLRFLWERVTDFVYFDHPVHQQERFFLMEGSLPGLLVDVRGVHEREGILEMRWWDRTELESTKELVFPEELATKLRKISP